MQKLIMPFTRCMMLCGYKNARYAQEWGYPHYGVDISTIQGNASDDHTVRASGDGVVLAAGHDSRLGYGVAVLYKDVYNHRTGKSCDVVARYMHLESRAITVGDILVPGDAIGQEGKEGTTDYHLHLEFDTDVTPAYATWSPQVAGTGGFWKKGIDSTVNPSFLLHIGAGQSLAQPTYNPAWLNAEDFAIPVLQEDCTGCQQLQKQLEEALAARRAAEQKLDQIAHILEG